MTGPCGYGCGKQVRYTNSGQKGCKECYDKSRAAVPLAFEPQAHPGEAWTGRPFADERNKFRMPDYNRGVPVRDILANPLRIGVCDIEATALNASFGRVLCGVTRLFGPDELRVRRADEFAPWKAGRRSDDSELVRAILMDLEECDIVFGHNINNYDLPFLRTRAMVYRFPPVHPKKIVDPVLLARRAFRFHSNRLDSINQILQTSVQKTELDPNVWCAASMDGSKEAMDLIVEHCIRDVDSLCESARVMAPYLRQIDTLGSFRQ